MLIFFAPEEFVSIAMDSASATTGPVNIPLNMALAIGLAKVLENVDPLLSGFWYSGTYLRWSSNIGFDIRDNNEDIRGGKYYMDVKCIVAIVERGKADKVVDKAKKAGARGATILYGKGTGQSEALEFLISTLKHQKKLF